MRFIDSKLVFFIQLAITISVLYWAIDYAENDSSHTSVVVLIMAIPVLIIKDVVLLTAALIMKSRIKFYYITVALLWFALVAIASYQNNG